MNLEKILAMYMFYKVLILKIQEKKLMDIHNSVMIVAGEWGGGGREGKWEVNRQNILYGTLFLTRKCNNLRPKDLNRHFQKYI